MNVVDAGTRTILPFVQILVLSLMKLSAEAEAKKALIRVS